MFLFFPAFFSILRSLVPHVDDVYDTTSPILSYPVFTSEVTLYHYTAVLASAAVVVYAHFTLPHLEHLHLHRLNSTSSNAVSFLELPGLPLVAEDKAPTSGAYMSRLVRGRVQCPLAPAPVSPNNVTPVYFMPVKVPRNRTEPTHDEIQTAPLPTPTGTTSVTSTSDKEFADSLNAHQFWTTQESAGTPAAVLVTPLAPTSVIVSTPGSPLAMRIAFGECDFDFAIANEIIQPLVDKVVHEIYPVLSPYTTPLFHFVDSLRTTVASWQPIFASISVVPVADRVATTRKRVKTLTRAWSAWSATTWPSSSSIWSRSTVAPKRSLERLKVLQARNPLATCDACPSATQWRRFACAFVVIVLLLYEGIALVLRLRHAHRAAAAAADERELFALANRNRRQRRQAERATRSVSAPKTTHAEMLAKKTALLRELNNPLIDSRMEKGLGVLATEVARWWRGARH